jgi:excisionase family DNA binding protein
MRSPDIRKPAAGSDSLIDCHGLAELLGVDVGFVRRLVAERRVPFVKIGKFVRFDPRTVSTWVDNQRIDAAVSRSRPGIR